MARDEVEEASSNELSESTPEGKSNPEFEATLLKDPDNVETYLVYGDWLQSQGDPRGELIALQHAASKAEGAEASDLKRRVTALIQKHQALLLGSLATPWADEELSLEWHLGFIRAARVGRKEFNSTLDVSETVSTLLAHPSARFLKSLTVGIVTADGGNDYEDVTQAIIQAKGSSTIQSLFLGDFDYPRELEISWTYLNGVSGLYAALPHLRSLRLRGAALDLGEMDLPELRDFTLETGSLPLAVVKSIASPQGPGLVQRGVHGRAGEGVAHREGAPPAREAGPVHGLSV
ncbi:TIGR02996 domain-containing protein [Myxococcus sp. CA051A]|uniref:TIGR02996 domain-containing protein n=1 Tax=Myxococcus sp. CA051A TaxID=2741739 RepID=UPI0020C626A6|nr:TIGR02996 domain-containing protein [Myxococcus sp. CA051A]